MLVLPMLVFLLALLLILLVFLRLDPIALLHLAEAQRVAHESLVCGLLLLLDSQQRVFPNLRCCVPHGICILRRNEVLVRSTELLIE